MPKRMTVLVLVLCLLFTNIPGAFATQESDPTQAATEATEAVIAPEEGTEPSQPTQTEATAPDETQATVPSSGDTEEQEDDTPRQKLPRYTVRSEADRVRNRLMDLYDDTLAETGLKSLKGYCGLHVSWQLYLLGINSSLHTLDGNNHYDFYSQYTMTSGGHTSKAYSAQDYTMAQALNEITANGTQDAYNIMVCFEKTNSEAGQKYGHVTLIHAILDGTVYFSEGFPTYLGEPGAPLEISLNHYPAFWEGWTEYEGLVYFGKGDPLSDYQKYPTDMFIACDVHTVLCDLPEYGQVLRAAKAGERLLVSAILKARDGMLYYQVEDDGVQAYIPVDGTHEVRVNTESVTLSDLESPEKLELGENYLPSGKIRAERSRLGQIFLRVIDDRGTQVLETNVAGTASYCDLSSWNVRNAVDWKSLCEGAYTYCVSAHVLNYCVRDGEVEEQTQEVCLHSVPFTVGQAVLPRQREEEAPEFADGWHYLQNAWYFYRDGQPLQGWICSDGVSYYLDEAGAAVTGWQEINGQMRYFSGTGAMRTGWMETGEGTRFLLRNGAAVKGWTAVDGQKYLFDENGFLRRDGWVKLEDRLYYLDENGQAAVGWVDLPQGRFSFHPDGYLLSVMVEGKITPYDGAWDPTEE